MFTNWRTDRLNWLSWWRGNSWTPQGNSSPKYPPSSPSPSFLVFSHHMLDQPMPILKTTDSVYWFVCYNQGVRKKKIRQQERDNNNNFIMCVCTDTSRNSYVQQRPFPVGPVRYQKHSPMFSSPHPGLTQSPFMFPLSHFNLSPDHCPPFLTSLTPIYSLPSLPDILTPICSLPSLPDILTPIYIFSDNNNNTP